MENSISKSLDEQNAAFWSELCGSAFAQVLGITDHSIPSLRRFDQAYFDLYPYLLKHVNPSRMKGKKVLEIGLGFGTLGQKIAESGAIYLGMDIAPTPVQMMKHRLKLLNLAGDAVQENFLQNTLPDESMDFVVSIGCFHHTGSVARALQESYRKLKPGGTLIFMVYNRFSGRQWRRWPLTTLRALLQGSNITATEAQRGAYDARIAGESAPETEFLSIADLKKLLADFKRAKFSKENCDHFSFRGHRVFTRDFMLPWFGPLLGLDIYVEAQK